MAIRDDQDVEDLLRANSVSLVSDMIAIPLAVVFLIIVQKIYRMQVEQAKLQSFT